MSILTATTIGGLGLSALSGVLGMSQASKARRQQQALINRQAASNEAWYQRNYYQNYLDSSEARSAMKRVEDTLRRRNQQAEGQAAVTGATREAVLAQQENDQTALADTAERLAARGDEVKRQVDAQNQANKAGITNMEMQQAQRATQGKRATILFELYPKLEEAYNLINSLRAVFRNKELTKETAKEKLEKWYDKVAACTLREIKSVRDTIKFYEGEILNYFIERQTNASAESLNSKIKCFRAQVKGVRDIPLFMYRLATVLG